MENDDISIRVSADTRAAQAALSGLSRDAQNFAGAINGAFRDAITGGRDFESILGRLAMRLAGMALNSALRPIGTGIADALGTLMGGFGFAKGGVLNEGRVKPFAQGGVIAAPSYFPLAKGVGLAGEAGPEAIMPLSRGSDGKLGVRSEGNAPVTIHFNVTSPDAAGFVRAEAQVTAMLARAVGRGRRGL